MVHGARLYPRHPNPHPDPNPDPNRTVTHLRIAKEQDDYDDNDDDDNSSSSSNNFIFAATACHFSNAPESITVRVTGHG